MKILNKKSLTKEWITPKAIDEGLPVPSFQISTLSNIQTLELKDYLVASAVQQAGFESHQLRFTKDVIIFILKSGWCGWRDMPDGYEWSDNINENIEVLDTAAMEWLANEIYYKSTLDRTDKKKS